jgi:hypothetical protein
MAEKSRRRSAANRPDEELDLDLAPDLAPEPAPAPANEKKLEETDSVPGQLARDDRGNINWQWSDDPAFQADDTAGATARIRALTPKSMQLEDEETATLKGAPTPVRRSPKAGYNPYESGEPSKKSRKKKRDLRELSKWVELKKKMSKRSDED